MSQEHRSIRGLIVELGIWRDTANESSYLNGVEHPNTIIAQGEVERCEKAIEEKFNEIQEDLLTRLFESTKALHERFGDKWTVDHALKKFSEESAEFIIECVDNNRIGGNTQQVLGEMVDVLVTMMSCCINLVIDPSGLMPAIEAVITKNDAKTLETHERVNGMIVRKK